MNPGALNHWLAAWQSFYSTVATVASTLTGLLFIAVSINHERLSRAENRPLLRLVVRSFGDYLFVLAVALMMLVPGQEYCWLSLLLIALSGLRIVRIVKDWTRPAYRHTSRLTSVQRAVEYAFPVGSSLALGGIAVLLLHGHVMALYILVPILTELMISATRNAWHALVLDQT